eukprot:GHVT01059127.1.p1 GENE.GHVT01059127.1~~GHVT01059127.1.p1  ORF type:complete len:131 (+),score=17.12 GHVT01059127.1:443-835(+)
MKYRLFPSLDFLAYLKRIHVAYHAGRDKTDVAKQLILKITSEKVQQKYPQLQVSWELLSYDAPATIDAEFRDGRKYRRTISHFSKREQSRIVDVWKLNASLEAFPELLPPNFTPGDAKPTDTDGRRGSSK